MTTTRRRTVGLSLSAQTARASKRARFTLVISGILLLLGMGAPQGAKAQVESTLYIFSGADGGSPYAGLVRDPSGNLYCTTEFGGTSHAGTVFELVYDSATNTYTEQVLYYFTGGTSDGASPQAGLIMDFSGNLYGTTPRGGPSDSGTVFELVYDSATNTYTEQVLHNFTPGTTDGASPVADLIMDPSGNLYGTTIFGGSSSACPYGCGTVFELVYNSITNSYAEVVLHNFTGSDGWQPMSGLIVDSSGNLYGTTEFGGSSSEGTVFELVYNSTTNSYTEDVLYSFGGGIDGMRPYGGLVMDPSGNLYGTTNSGGSSGGGIVFELTPDSSSPTGYSETVLHNFSFGVVTPYAGLVMDPSGNLYGTTTGNSGAVFGIAPVTLSASSLYFGIVEVGTASTSRSVTVTNIGNASLRYGAASFSGTNAADFVITTDGCGGSTVAPNSTCSVSVTFTPSTDSWESASLNLPESGLTQTVALTGTGALPTAGLSATSLTFPAQPVGGTSSGKTVTIFNDSTFTLNITAVSISGDFAITSNTCTATITAGNPCTVSITFSPTTTGTRTGKLSFTDNAADSPQAVSLSGTGTDFAISARTTSSTITAGGTASYDLLISPESGFSGDVSFTCSGAPSKSTCSVSPASVTLNGNDNRTVTLNVTTVASGIVPPALAPWDLPPMVVFWIGLLVLLGLGVPGRFSPARARMRPALLASLAAMLLAITFWTACGGGGSTASSVPHGTPAGTYTLTVTGASGGLSHSATVSLTVR